MLLWQTSMLAWLASLTRSSIYVIFKKGGKLDDLVRIIILGILRD